MVYYTTLSGSRRFSTLEKAREYAINNDIKLTTGAYGEGAIPVYKHTTELPYGYHVGDVTVQVLGWTELYEWIPVKYNKAGFGRRDFDNVVRLNKSGKAI